MIHISKPFIDGTDIASVVSAMANTDITLGGNIALFEKALSDYTGSEYVSTVSSGTHALHLLLVANNINEGDEVILPTLTFAATLWCVLYQRAKPIFVDSEVWTWNINPEAIEERITGRTKAIIAVDLYGCPSNVTQLQKIAEKYSIKLIFDSAQSLGAQWNGKRIGSFDDTIVSFYGNKIITTGEGGAIFTNERAIYDKIIHLKNHSMTEQYFHDDVGYNYRMDNLRASLGLTQLKKLDLILRKKHRISKLYDKFLKERDIPHVSQKISINSTSNNWVKPIILNKDIPSLRKELLNRGIETRPFFTPLHTLPFIDNQIEYPVAWKLYKKGICLPNHMFLEEQDIEYICRTLEELIK